MRHLWRRLCSELRGTVMAACTPLSEELADYQDIQATNARWRAWEEERSRIEALHDWCERAAALMAEER